MMSPRQFIISLVPFHPPSSERIRSLDREARRKNIGIETKSAVLCYYYVIYVIQKNEKVDVFETQCMYV